MVTGQLAGFFIIGMLVWGMVIGWIGEAILGKARHGRTNWLQALVAGAIGSVGVGAVGSLVAGEGFEFRPAGVVASIIGAVVVLLIWNAVAARKSK